MKITRRHVLAATAAATLATALGGAGLTASWWNRPPAEGLLALSPDEYAFAQAIAEAWLPPGGTPALSGADANLGAYLDEVLSRMEPTNGKLLKLLLQALDDRPMVPHGRSFHRLDLATRQAVLQGWINGNALLANGIAGLLVLLGMGWTVHPDVAALLRPSFGCGYGA